MPTTYAHDRFGREVYEQLPANLKKIIRENKKLYLIGLHGPDIFFYYHPFSKNRVSDYGTFLHEQTASVLFEDEVKKYQRTPHDATARTASGRIPEATAQTEEGLPAVHLSGCRQRKVRFQRLESGKRSV